MASALLSLTGIGVRRGMNHVHTEVDLVVNGGDMIVLSGANGAGKSTLLEVAAGLLPIEQGTVKHADTVVLDAEGRRKRSPLTVGLTLQKNGVLGSETVEEHLKVAMSMSGFQTETAPFLKAFNLDHRAHDLVMHLSQGQVRKVAVLAGILPAFVSPQPSLVLMDEPASGLDDASVEVLLGWLAALTQRGHGLVVCTHDERVRDQATRVVDLHGSATTEQTPARSASDVNFTTSTSRTVSAQRFGIRMHRRTMAWLNHNGMAALLTLGILLVLGDVMTQLDAFQQAGFILAPSLAAGLCGEAMVTMCREERVGAWWRGVAGSTPHAGWLPLLIGGAITLLTEASLMATITPVHVVVGAVLCAVAWHGVGFAQRSTERLARPQAVFIGLLTPVLILPYALVLDWLTR